MPFKENRESEFEITSRDPAPESVTVTLRLDLPGSLAALLRQVRVRAIEVDGDSIIPAFDFDDRRFAPPELAFAEDFIEASPRLNLRLKLDKRHLARPWRVTSFFDIEKMMDYGPDVEVVDLNPVEKLFGKLQLRAGRGPMPKGTYTLALAQDSGLNPHKIMIRIG